MAQFFVAELVETRQGEVFRGHQVADVGVIGLCTEGAGGQYQQQLGEQDRAAVEYALVDAVVTQQEVVHGVVERHAELEPLPHLGVTFVLVFDMQHDCLTVDVLHQRHAKRHGG